MNFYYYLSLHQYVYNPFCNGNKNAFIYLFYLNQKGTSLFSPKSTQNWLTDELSEMKKKLMAHKIGQISMFLSLEK